MRQLFIAIILGVIAWGAFKDASITAPVNEVSFEHDVHYSGDAGRNDELPLLIVLHGNGDTPENFIETALDQFQEPVRMVLLKAPVPMGLNGGAWPKHPEELQKYGEAINEVAALLSDKYETSGQAMVLGFSGGGMMAYYLAAAHPDQYSYIFPISGLLPEVELGDPSLSRDSNLQVYAFHGTQDRVVGVKGGRKAVALLKERQVSVTLQEFKGGHLGIFMDQKAEITQLIETKIRQLQS